MKSKLLVSQKVVSEFGPRLDGILRAAPRPVEIVPFTKDLRLADANAGEIEAAYYSRDVWEGTEKSTLSPAAQAFWGIIDRARDLKWLAVYSAGTDQKRYQDAMGRGIRLTTSAGAQSESVGLAAVAGLLTLARNVPHWWSSQQKAEWAPLRGREVPPDVPGQTALIVGTGYIGKVIARVLHAMGMKTIGIRRSQAPLEHFDRIAPLSALDSLLPECDWLVLAAPLVAETRGLMDRRRLALLKPGAGIVNVARGELIDEPALADALAGSRLRCAYLDVFAVEPLPKDAPLWRLPNVLISPHNAGASTGTYGRGVEIFLGNLERYLAGKPLVNEAQPDE
jgi:phosphoglycerate dehydrogenase-like enzyme